MTENTTTAAVENLTDTDYDIAQQILDAMALSRRTGAAYPPSMIARWVKGATTDSVRRVLPALVEDGHLTAEGTRAWTNYRFIYG